MNIDSRKGEVCKITNAYTWRRTYKIFPFPKSMGKVHPSASNIDIKAIIYKEIYRYGGGRVSSPQVHFKFIYIGLMFTNLGSKFTSFRVWKD